MDLATVFRIAFVVGFVAIVVLYVLFGRREDKSDQNQGQGDQNRGRNEDERGERERPSEKHGPNQNDDV